MKQSRRYYGQRLVSSILHLQLFILVLLLKQSRSLNLAFNHQVTTSHLSKGIFMSSCCYRVIKAPYNLSKNTRSYKSRQYRKSTTVHNNGIDDNDNDEKIRQYDNWEAGVDLKSDLQKLRMAVWENNAESDLKQKERIHLLDEFARQRRELIPDAKKYVLFPILAAVFLTYIQSKQDSTMRTMILLKSCLKIFLTLMNAMYSISIFVPIIMHHIVSRNDKQKEIKFGSFGPMTDDFESTSGSRNECSNYCLCLLENWLTSTYPSAILQTVVMASSIRNKFALLGYYMHPLLIPGSSPIFIFGHCLSRLLGRLGAAAALHQFPKLLYDLRRSNQARPIALTPYMLRWTIDGYLKILPFGFVADVTSLCAVLSLLKEQILFGTIRKFIGPISLLLILSILAPLVHLFALSRIIRVGHFTNISLAMDQSKAVALLDNKETDGFKLRYKLQWRPPFRILSSGGAMFRNFFIFLFKGWGEQASIMNDSSEIVSSGSEPYLLTLVGREMEQHKINNTTQPISDRSNWVKDASERMARIHEQNYRNKRFDDPLGIAFQQTFGIGMSLDFDHDSRLSLGETPSVHRLRARAAKSVIKRFYALPDQVKKQVGNIQDEDERLKKYNELIKKKEKQMIKIAKEISLLIPVNAASPEGKDLDVFSMRMSEANQLDSVSLPWLLDEVETFDDPYLSFEGAFLYDQKQRTKDVDIFNDNIDEDDGIFSDIGTVLT